MSDAWDRKFREDLAADVAFESGLLIKEACALAFVVALILIRAVLL